MQINWLVRFKNPVFWIQIVSITVLTLISGVGLKWEDMTSWPILADTLLQAILNPVTVVAVLVAWWTAITDPTTRGTSDGVHAMKYEEPAPNIATISGEADAD